MFLANGRYFLTWLIVATVLVYGLASIARWWWVGAIVWLVEFLALKIGVGANANLRAAGWFGSDLVAMYVAAALPYAAIATMFCRMPKPALALGVIGLVINHFGQTDHDGLILAAAMGALLFGLAVPTSWRMPWLVRHLAGCTYGIYLGHMLVLFLALKVCKWTGLPVERHTAGIVGVALVTFAVSWAGTVILQQWGWTRAVFLGQTQKKHPGAGTRVGGVVLRPTKKEKGKGPEIKELCGGVALIRQ